MQCPACQFENLPGLPQCARCGSVLVLDDIGLEPPRASVLRLGTHAERVGRRLGRVAVVFRGLHRLVNRLAMAPVPWRALAWSVIPGLGHYRLGLRRWGRVYLSIWCAGLVLTALTLGSRIDWLVFQIVLVTHSMAVVALFAANLAFERILVRLAFGALVYGCVYYVVYRPPIWLAERLVARVPLNNITPGPVIRNDDVLVYQGPWLRPERYERGTIVVCRLPALSGGVYMPAGMNVDRIVGVPGDVVEVRADGFYVNGQPPPPEEAPLGPVLVLPDVRWQLGRDEYIVFPSRIDLGANSLEELESTLISNMVRQICFVRHDEIAGAVLFRLRPLARLGGLGAEE